MNRRPSRQRGVAAVEFAFMLMAIFTLLYGALTLGAVFYIQQSLVRAAEDGARATQTLPNGAAPDLQRVRDVVWDSLAASLTTPVAVSHATTDRRAWIASHVEVSVAGTSTVVVSVRYRYSDNRLLPSLPLVDASRWTPDVLTGRATIANPA